jgi:hypothetical protein
MFHAVGGSTTPLQMGLLAGMCQGDLARITKLLTEVIRDVACVP